MHQQAFMQPFLLNNTPGYLSEQLCAPVRGPPPQLVWWIIFQPAAAAWPSTLAGPTHQQLSILSLFSFHMPYLLHSPM